MKKNIWLTFYLISITKFAVAQADLGRVKSVILKTVVRIETSTGNTGTGFIVFKTINKESNQGYLYLVTNKHIISDWSLANPNGSFIYNFLELSLYTNDTLSKSKSFQRVKIPIIENGKLSNIVRSHSDTLVDVVIINITNYVTGTKNVDIKYFDSSFLVRFDEISSKGFIGVGDQVFALGYPIGITSQLQ
jgi:hypothetical protein